MCNITMKTVADLQHYTLGHNYDAHSAKWPHKNKEFHEYDNGFQQKESFLTRLHVIHYDEHITLRRLCQFEMRLVEIYWLEDLYIHL